VFLSCTDTTPKLLEKQNDELTKLRDGGALKEASRPLVDILFVVDDSGSMASHQENLANNIELFVNEIVQKSQLDYHIGVITTTDAYSDYRESGGGVLVGKVPVVSRSTRNGVAELAKNLKVGIEGDGSEKFFLPVKMALSEPLLSTANRGFLRRNAPLALIFITDTDDQTTGISTDDFANWLIGLKGNTRNVLVYGVYIPLAEKRCERFGEEPPERLEAFFERMQALHLSFSLCSPDYGKRLAGLANDLVGRVGSRFPLARFPDPETIVVRYGTQVIPNDYETGWTYDPESVSVVMGPKVTFSSQPPGTEVVVEFVPAKDQPTPDETK